VDKYNFSDQHMPVAELTGGSGWCDWTDTCALCCPSADYTAILKNIKIP